MKLRNVIEWMTAENRFKHREVRSLDKRCWRVIVNTIYYFVYEKEEYFRGGNGYSEGI